MGKTRELFQKIRDNKGTFHTEHNKKERKNEIAWT